jgi:hypothetical protein
MNTSASNHIIHKSPAEEEPECKTINQKMLKTLQPLKIHLKQLEMILFGNWHYHVPASSIVAQITSFAGFMLKRHHASAKTVVVNKR